MSIDRELDLASNMFGRLPPESRARLQALYDNPTEETWDNAYTLILERHTHTSLWQAVIAVDPTFPQVGPSSDNRGNRITTWRRIPDRDLIRRALTYATH